jgi:hypothetical protein
MVGSETRPTDEVAGLLLFGAREGYLEPSLFPLKVTFNSPAFLKITFHVSSAEKRVTFA